MFLQKSIKQLDSLEWGYLLGAALPGALFIVALNLFRLADDDVSRGLWGNLDMLKSEVFLGLGLAAGGLALLHFLRGRRGRRFICALLLIFWAMTAFIEVAGHQFFVTTGSVLDYYLLAFSLENWGDNAQVIASEIPTWIYLIVPLVSGSILVAPWVIRWAIRRQVSPEGPTPPNPPARPTALLALLLLIASTLPAYSGQATQNARATTPTLAITAFGAFRASLTDIETSQATTLDIRLEPRRGEGQDGAAKKRNLVFLILESTRASSTTIYNDSLDTTPFLAELAARSTVAENAYVLVPHSSKALSAILCGIAPNLHMPITEAIPGNIPGRCLPELLGEQGYQSIFLQSATGAFENRAQLVDNFGFDDFISGDDLDPTGFEKANYFGYEDDILLKPSQKWLEAHKDKPIFATYFTLTPHHQYLAPRRYGRHDFASDDLLNRYLNTIHYIDNFVKNILDQYKKLGLYEDTIFVIVGDHGEGLGEHGRFQHDNVIYQEGVRVPFLIYDPQAPQPRRVAYNVNHLDVVPTVLEQLNYDVKNGRFPGTPILEVDHERPMRMHCWYERRCMAQIIGAQKYIFHFDTQRDEFFDLGADPDERHNIAASQPDVSLFRRELLEWREKIIGMHQAHAASLIDDVLFAQMPEVQQRVDIQFGDEIMLRGYDISVQSAQPGGRFRVTWYFESLKKAEPDARLFVHMRSNGKMKNLDHVPAGGLFPIENWQPGAIIADTQDVRIPPNWKPGEIRLYLGVYNATSGERRKVTGGMGIDEKQRAFVVTVPNDMSP